MARWVCERPGCEREATVPVSTMFGRVDCCGWHCAEVADGGLPVWLFGVFGREAPERFQELTALCAAGFGLRVYGSVRSVELVLKDAVRHGMAKVALLTDRGLVMVDARRDWELRAVRRAERPG